MIRSDSLSTNYRPVGLKFPSADTRTLHVNAQHSWWQQVVERKVQLHIAADCAGEDNDTGTLISSHIPQQYSLGSVLRTEVVVGVIPEMLDSHAEWCETFHGITVIQPEWISYVADCPKPKKIT